MEGRVRIWYRLASKEKAKWRTAELIGNLSAGPAFMRVQKKGEKKPTSRTLISPVLYANDTGLHIVAFEAKEVGLPEFKRLSYLLRFTDPNGGDKCEVSSKVRKRRVKSSRST